MIIDLDAKTRIRGTSDCWQLEFVRISNGKPEWRPRKFFASLEQAVNAASAMEIRTSPAHGVVEAKAACERIAKKYEEILSGVHQLTP